MNKKHIIKFLSCFIPTSAGRKAFRARHIPPPEWTPLDRLREVFPELKAKADSLELAAPTLESLFLGSSHIAYGLNPDYFSPGAFNLGSTSQDLFTAYHVLEKLLPRLPRLQQVFIGCDVFTRGWNLAYTSARNVCSSYKYLFDIDYQPANYLENYEQLCKALLASYTPPARISNGFLHPPVISMGKSPEERAATHLREFRRPVSQLPWVEKAATLLEEAGKGMKLFLVIAPVRADMLSSLPPKEELFAEWHALAAQRGIRVLDLFDDSEFCDEDFYDFDHLNALGAEKFSAKLKLMARA